MREYLRPNFFANTPDILHAYLQNGGRPAFEARLVLAATLGATYGIYSGFELCENARSVPGTEEYLDSEKYQIRHWDWNRPGHIKELVARGERRSAATHPALQCERLAALLHDRQPAAASPTARRRPTGSDVVLVDRQPRSAPHAARTRGGAARAHRRWRPTPYTARDLLSDDAVYSGAATRNYVRLDPGGRQAHILSLEPGAGAVSPSNPPAT